MMISCKKASQLASESLERQLSWWERLRLKFHCGMCHWCGGHAEDMEKVRNACRCKTSDSSPTEELSPEARERIMAIVRQHLDDEEQSGS